MEFYICEFDRTIEKCILYFREEIIKLSYGIKEENTESIRRRAHSKDRKLV